jgi:Asparagine synthase
MLYANAKTVLPNFILNYLADRMEMAHSIEGRVPFLDHHVADVAARAPVTMKVKGIREKHVLREASKDVLIPEVYGRQKHRSPRLRLATQMTRCSPSTRYVRLASGEGPTDLRHEEGPHGARSAGASLRQARVGRLSARVHLRENRFCRDQREGHSQREIVVEGTDSGSPDDAASARVSSSMAKWSPMQVRGPALKGMYCQRSRPAAFSGLNRSCPADMNTMSSLRISSSVSERPVPRNSATRTRGSCRFGE